MRYLAEHRLDRHHEKSKCALFGMAQHGVTKNEMEIKAERARLIAAVR